VQPAKEEGGLGTPKAVAEMVDGTITSLYLWTFLWCSGCIEKITL
jgi:hypothetical protein